MRRSVSSSAAVGGHNTQLGLSLPCHRHQHVVNSRPAMRRAASAHAFSLTSAPRGSTSTGNCCSAAAASSSNASTCGSTALNSPLRGRTHSTSTLRHTPQWGTTLPPFSRRTLPSLRALPDNLDSWDEEEFRAALNAGAGPRNGPNPTTINNPSGSTTGRRNTQPAAASTSAPLLPVFEWDLPSFPEFPPTTGAPVSGLPKRVAPWDKNARQRRVNQHTLSQQSQSAQQPWGYEKKKSSASGRPRKFHSWSENVVPPGVDIMDNLQALTRMDEVFVILFGVGDGGDEGIYSLKSLSGHGVAVDTVIAFESEVDAERYAALLEAVMVWKPSVCSILPLELVEFVMDSGLNCRLQPQGSHIFPPDWSVPMGLTDWERTARLRKGHYSVLEAEPGSAQHVDIEPETALPSVGGLDHMRQRLEDIYSAS